MNILLVNANNLLGRKFAQRLKKEGQQFFQYGKDDINEESLDELITKSNFIFHFGNEDSDRRKEQLYHANVVVIKQIIEIIEKRNLKIPIVFISSAIDEHNDFVEVKKESEEELKAYQKKTKNPVFVLKVSNIYGDEKCNNYYSQIYHLMNLLMVQQRHSLFESEDIIRVVDVEPLVDFLLTLLNKDLWSRLNPPHVDEFKIKDLIKTINEYRRLLYVRRVPIIESSKDLAAYKIFRTYVSPNAPQIELKKDVAPKIEVVKEKEVKQTTPHSDNDVMKTRLDKGYIYIAECGMEANKVLESFRKRLEGETGKSLFIDKTWYETNYEKYVTNVQAITDNYDFVLVDGVGLSEIRVQILANALDYGFRNKTVLVVAARDTFNLRLIFMKLKKLHFSKLDEETRESRKGFTEYLNNFKTLFKREKTSQKTKPILKEKSKLIVEDEPTKIEIEQTTIGKRKVSKFFLLRELFFVVFMILSLISSNLTFQNDTNTNINATITAAHYQANRAESKYIHGYLSSIPGSTDGTSDLEKAFQYGKDIENDLVNYYVTCVKEPVTGAKISRSMFNIIFPSGNTVANAVALKDYSSNGQLLKYMKVEQYLFGDKIDKTPTNEEATPIYISSTLADIIIESSEFINNYSDLIDTTITRTYTRSYRLISEQLEIKNIIYTSNKEENYYERENSNPYSGIDEGLGQHLDKIFGLPIIFLLDSEQLSDFETRIEFDAFPKGNGIKKLLDHYYKDDQVIEGVNYTKNVKFGIYNEGKYNEDNFILNDVNAYYQTKTSSVNFTMIIFAIFSILFAFVAANILLTNLKEALKYSNSRVHVVLGLIFTVIPIIVVNFVIALYKGLSNYSVSAIALQNTFGIIANGVITLVMASLTLFFFFSLRKENKRKAEREAK